MRALLLLLLLCINAHATIYRWVDERGVAHYSDIPPTAEALPTTVAPGSRVDIRTPTVAKKPTTTEQTPAPDYRLAILSPTPDATVRNNEGKLVIKVATDPNPAEGHHLQLLIDDQAHPMEGRQLTLNNMDRGTHQLQALLVDSQGVLLAESPPITIHLHRQSAQFGKPRHQRPSPAQPTP